MTESRRTVGLTSTRAVGDLLFERLARLIVEPPIIVLAEPRRGGHRSARRGDHRVSCDRASRCANYRTARGTTYPAPAHAPPRCQGSINTEHGRCGRFRRTERSDARGGVKYTSASIRATVRTVGQIRACAITRERSSNTLRFSSSVYISARINGIALGPPGEGKAAENTKNEGSLCPVWIGMLRTIHFVTCQFIYLRYGYKKKFTRTSLSASRRT